MRRIVWSLVVGGLVGSGPAIGVAEDPPARTSSDQSAPASSGRGLSEGVARPPVKNYHTELFGTKSAADAAFAGSQTDGAQAPAAARGSRLTLTNSKKTSQAAAMAADEESVVHADYERQAHETEKSKIRQVTSFSGNAASLTEPININRPAAKAPVRADVTASLQVDHARKTITRSPQATSRAAVPLARTASSPVEVPAPPTPAVSTAQAAQTHIPAVSLEWKRRSEINVGQEFDCDLIVKNTGNVTAQHLSVSAHFPKTVQLISVTRPDSKEGKASPSPSPLTWEFAALQPGEEVVIQFRLVSLKAGPIAPHADVQFTGSASGQFEVAQPMLAIKLDGPNRVLVGDSAAHTVTISNPGNGVAANVQLEALIPPGLEHVRGARLLMDLGALHPGETRSVRLPLAAVTGGSHLIQVQAQAGSDLVQNAHSEVNVIAPKMAAAIDGPGLRYLGRQATYTLRVTNEGGVATDNVRLMHKVPDGFTFVRAGHGAQFDANSRLVNWFVGRLERGQTAKVEVTFECDQIGSFTHFVRATSEHGSIADGKVSTLVEGTPSLALEVRDLDDPVEVGVETAYEIKVKNEGSAPAKQVNVSCELPAGLSLVDVSGPVDCIAEKNLLVFRALPVLDAGSDTTFTVRVKGTAAGNLRFRVRLSSESIEEPLISEELTKFYGE